MGSGVRYRRVVLKVSGEALGSKGGRGVGMAQVRAVAREVKDAHDAGVELVVVVGGGNLVRGRDFADDGVEPATADAMGMLATVINGLALHQALGEVGVDARVQSAIPVGGLAEPFSRAECLRHLAGRKVVVCAGGTGNPHFTTDTGAALRAREVRAGVVLKATNVDGVYSDDPRKNPEAKRFRRLTYREVIERDLKVMDITAITLCREGRIPIVVFDLGVPGNVLRAIGGEDVGTYVGDD